MKKRQHASRQEERQQGHSTLAPTEVTVRNERLPFSDEENGLIGILVSIALQSDARKTESKDSIKPRKASGGAFSAVFAQLEVFLFLFEYLLLLVFINLAWESSGVQPSWTSSRTDISCDNKPALQSAICILNRDKAPIIFSAFKVLLGLALTCCYLILRASKFFGISPGAYVSKGLRLGSECKGRRTQLVGYISSLFEFLVFHYCVSGASFESPSLENFKVNGNFDYSLAMELLFAIPIKEEMLFRGLISMTIYNRFRDLHVTVWNGAAWFSAFHLLNLFQNRFSVSYVYLQVFVAFYMGAYYNYVFMNSSVSYSILLHVWNNCLNSLTPASLDTNDTCFYIQVLIQLLLHAAAIAHLAGKQ